MAPRLGSFPYTVPILCRNLRGTLCALGVTLCLLDYHDRRRPRPSESAFGQPFPDQKRTRSPPYAAIGAAGARLRVFVAPGALA